MTCTPPRIRHRFNDQGNCKYCGTVGAESLPETKIIKAVSGTSVKLAHVSNLIDTYTKAREELERFLRQHCKTEVEFTDPLEEVTIGYLDQLYKDFGREVFWKEKDKSI